MMRWLARLASLGVMAAFSLLLEAVAINADPVEPPGMPILALMVVTILGCVAAWRWQRAGGVLLIATAGALIVTALAAGSAFGLGSEGLLAAAVYGLPVLTCGSLFLVSSMRRARLSEG